MKSQHILFAILVAALWGFNFIAIKLGLNDMPPFLYCSARFVISCLPLLPFVKKPPVSWPIIIGIGLSLGVAKFGFLFMGLHLGMSAGLSSLVLQSQVFFTILLSLMLLSEKMRLQQVIGMAIAFAGITLIAIHSHEGSTLVGFLLVIAAALSWAYCNILIKLAGKVNMFSLVIWTCLIPILPMYVLSLIFEGPNALPDMITHMTPIGWACLLYASCAATWIGSTLWGILLRTYDASLVAPYALLIPVFGISFGHVVLGEQFSLLTYMACGIVFAGLVINQWKTKKAQVPSLEIANPPTPQEQVA